MTSIQKYLKRIDDEEVNRENQISLRFLKRKFEDIHCINVKELY